MVAHRGTLRVKTRETRARGTCPAPLQGAEQRQGPGQQLRSSRSQEQEQQEWEQKNELHTGREGKLRGPFNQPWA